jgi:hypothetical protein
METITTFARALGAIGFYFVISMGEEDDSTCWRRMSGLSIHT